MRVSVDVHVCTGHGRCYVLAPDVFGSDDYGHCEVLISEPGTLEHETQARLGAENCPERAISIDGTIR